MKVYLDTNVLVSAVATRGLCADVLHLVLAEHQLVAGAAVVRELRRVLKTKFRVPVDDIDEVEAFIRRHASMVDRAEVGSIAVRDPADALILAEAIGGQADVLVTGDRDLLDLAADLPLTVVTPRAFWDRLRSSR